MNFSNLLHWAAVFFIIALVAAFLGFGTIVGPSLEGAKFLFWAAIILAVISAVIGLVRKS
ncbi:DUF1328 domain-containing protein [Aestuariivirga litoralis]|uniref:DUF1328 domain-containing protein n=1 Tax=Aestuariivirga litoralis TaxID=2650924 RepID=UPI0018C59887|nr:DUF1328 domain-containing protein [Aestuariivirga litoralis]MBG1232420.1 DUF1328 domain-containing protein [Aestuariivirga litoralis]